MKKKIRGALLSAAALALIGLSSCSEPAEEAAPEGSASEPAAAAQPAGPEGESEKNARALLKGMSDYLAAQKDISLSYDSIFEVVTDDKQKHQNFVARMVAKGYTEKQVRLLAEWYLRVHKSS